MFDFVRTHNRLFQFILVLLVFPSFVFFGVQGYSRFNDAAAVPVAKVDGRNITRAEWDKAHQATVERMRRQMPTADLASLDSPQARQQTLESLLRERLLAAAAAGELLMPSDERLSRLFKSDPQFAAIRNPDGTVNRDLLAAQGMSSDGFAEQLRMELGMRQVLDGVGASAFVPASSSKTATDSLLQRRVVQWQRLDAKEHAGGIKPSEQELADFLKAQEVQFRLPEEARIEYVVLDLQGLKATVQVSEEELRRYYAENESRYTRAQERRASHILIAADKGAAADKRKQARETAQSLRDQALKAPGSFAELARKNSQDPGSAGKGGDLDFFARGAMVKPFEDAVFAMKPGEISPVIESEFGYHVIQLTGVRGGEKKTFEAVRSEIDSEVRTQLAQRRFAEAAESFTNTVYEQPDSLQPVVDKLKLERRTATVFREPAAGATGVLASPRFLAAVFSDDVLRNRRNAQAIDLGNNQLASARVLSHQPARTPPLADVVERVRAAFVAKKSADLAREKGEARLAALRADPTLSLPQTETVSRIQPAGLPREAMDAVLRAPADKLPAVVGVSLGDQGYLVARVTQVLPAQVPAGLDSMMKAQLAQAWAGAESQAYYELLKKRYKGELVGPGAASVAATATTAAATGEGAPSAPSKP